MHISVDTYVKVSVQTYMEAYRTITVKASEGGSVEIESFLEPFVETYRL